MCVWPGYLISVAATLVIAGSVAIIGLLVVPLVINRTRWAGEGLPVRRASVGLPSANLIVFLRYRMFNPLALRNPRTCLIRSWCVSVQLLAVILVAIAVTSLGPTAIGVTLGRVS